ncbi:MAG: hypothetical protein WDO73_15665 [Ignavibacteriota bacterium]
MTSTSSLKKAGGDSNVITMIAPTREQIPRPLRGDRQRGEA